jgi:hypothetical protein
VLREINRCWAEKKIREKYNSSSFFTAKYASLFFDCVAFMLRSLLVVLYITNGSTASNLSKRFIAFLLAYLYAWKYIYLHLKATEVFKPEKPVKEINELLKFVLSFLRKLNVILFVYSINANVMISTDKDLLMFSL